MDGPQEIRRHLSFLALSFAAVGALSVVGGVALVIFGLAGGGAMALGGAWGQGAGLATLAIVFGVGIALTGVPELLAWIGLTRREPWGRWLALALCTAGIAAFPLGTMLGSYGLWVLLSQPALAEFRIQRSWLSDGAALLFGWMMRPDDGRSSSRRRRRRSRGGGAGCLAFVVLLLGFMLFVSCAEMASSCAGRAMGGTHGYEHMTPRARVQDTFGIELPSFDGTDARTGTDRGADAPDQGTAGGQSLAPAPPPPTPPAPDTAPPAPPVPDASSQKGRAVFMYTEADGTPVLVDDVNKVPEARKHTLRSP